MSLQFIERFQFFDLHDLDPHRDSVRLKTLALELLRLDVDGTILEMVLVSIPKILAFGNSKIN